MRPPSLTRLVRSPLFWLVAVAAVIRTVGIGWGLPASDGWDNDGIAPRDFLAGLVETVTPGHFYTYPPVHLLLLALLTAPITLTALVRAPSLASADVLGEILSPSYMTANAYVARLVSMLMSLGTIVLVARMAEELRALELGELGESAGAPKHGRDPRVERTGACAGAFVVANLSATYYAHTTNLDGPYLFWGLAALLVLVRAVARADYHRLRVAFALAVLAVGTKDQAYALFLITIPVVLVVALGSDARLEGGRRRALLQVIVASAVAAGLLLVVDGILLNPSGFRARLAFLTGSASKDFVTYSDDWVGRARMLGDVPIAQYWPWPLAVACAGGAAVAVGRALRADRSERVLRVLLAATPLLALVSFTVSFNFEALRTDHRFFLPHSLLLAVYGGHATEPLLFAGRAWVKWTAQATASIAFAFALHACLAVDAQLLYDPRYEAEAWLAAQLRPGEIVETYGNNVYLPRFPAHARVLRVGPEEPSRRNPMPGIEEVKAPFGEASARGARFIVLPGGWTWRYLIDPNPKLEPGEVMPKHHRVTSNDAEATSFFWRLVRNQDDFVSVKAFEYEPRFFPKLDIHASTARGVWIFERRARP